MVNSNCRSRLAVLAASATVGRTQPMIPPDPDYALSSWSFLAPGWLSASGDAPLGFTNLENPASFDGNAVQVDFPDGPAYLNYAIADDLATNLTFPEGTIEFWVLPDWNTGTGPGGWGRLIDVGICGTNNPSSWWSLYFSPDGSSISFSSETNGVFTNYLSCPISFDNATWHLIDLTYNHFRSELYVDGQLATNGPGVHYLPSDEAVSNGFFIGSGFGGLADTQARAQFDDLATFDYALNADEVASDYAAGVQLMAPLSGGGGLHTTDDTGSGMNPPGSGSGTNSVSSNYATNNPAPSYGTNLWLALLGISNHLASLQITNTSADILFELQGCTNLAQGNWFSEGFVNGSELTNCVPASVPVSQQGNLFLRIRSWADDTGTGIPDWWWLEYFGQITNVNPYAADPAGDGYDNLQKFQMGLNPNLYYNSNAPSGFFGALDASGTNAYLEWSPAPGPVINYAIQRGIQDTNGNYVYAQIGLVSSNATYFEDVGAITNDNAQNNLYNLTAVYPGGSLSATDTWNVSWYVDWYLNGWYDQPYGPPVPNNVVAYATSTGTNVLITWTPVQGMATNSIVELASFDETTWNNDYYPLAAVGTNASYLDVGAVQSDAASNLFYAVEAVFPGGVLSAPATAYIHSTPPSPTGFTAALDATGTNVLISWTPPSGIVVTNYIIERGVLNTNTGAYTYSTNGQVSGGSTCYEDFGAIAGNSSYHLSYEMLAEFLDGSVSEFDYAYLNSPAPPASFNANISLTAYLVRNGTGRWQVMFSGFPTNYAQTLQLTWTDGYGTTNLQTISTTNLANGVYAIADTNVVNLLGYSLAVQLFGPDGEPGQVTQAGVLANNAPYFVDGRQQMMQNLNFLMRGASDGLVFFASAAYFGSGRWGLYNNTTAGAFNQTATNFEEFSFLHHGSSSSYFPGTLFLASENLTVFQLDNLWPFTANYNLANYLVQTTRTNVSPYGGTNFAFQLNFATNLPAPLMLSQPDPYWILQNGFNAANAADWTAAENDSQTELSLASGGNNLFGLPYQTGCEVDMQQGLGSIQCLYQELSPGGNVTANSGYSIGDYASCCPAPVLLLTNYYFVRLNNFSGDTMGLPGAFDGNGNRTQPPTPLEDSFSVTNQTPPLIVGTVGQPMILASWAKYAIENGSTSTGKYAYLGQYFATNAFLLNASGVATTNSAGILSPYGEFFPTQAGQTALVTMPDANNDPVGTGVVDVISLDTDANHDGIMDFTYSGPDQTSSSRPFRFWVNDVNDSGDDGGNGIPGASGSIADGVMFSDDANGLPLYTIQGSRNLVNFFPVYLNIGSLFQSNALSAGISVTDTNWQFVLSQADGALRFAYTDLTPTNYMNFLRDTNEVLDYLHDAPLTTVSDLNSGGVPVAGYFLNQIAGNNGGIILMEAWKPTTQPLVLSIYHGTNQIAQTQLYLSISGVEQMFRSKTMLLNPTPGTVADRLTDAQVPNEPDTIDKNFVFLHGYNVLPTEARGVQSDMFKRMYWAGSHAKFWGVTWEGADTKNSIPLKFFTPNYYTNIVNAFLTAPMLANFITSLTNIGPVVVAAHSMGNVVTMSSISDWNAPISQYFMLDAAIPTEAIDPSVALTNAMVYSSWTGYSNRLFASDWYQLFPTNDARSTLSWNNRLGNLQNVAVYNFYSSGEEVLREYNGNPPINSLSAIAAELINYWPGGLPIGVYAWVWQEKGKGTCIEDGFVGGSYGGWKFSTYWVDSNGFPLSPSIMNDTTNATLQYNPMFNFNSTVNYSLRNIDSELLGAVYGVNPSTYAATNRNRILSDAIPALTLPAGANPVPRFSPPTSPVQKNFDMQSVYENGWPAGRPQLQAGNPAAGEWHHSDFQQVAYTFTYPLFSQLVTLGNLK